MAQIYIETNCSICNKKIGGKDRFKESRLGIFTPVIENNEVSYFAMGDNRLALCKSCTQSLYSWIKNRKRKKYIPDLLYKKPNIGSGDCACVTEQLNRN